VNVSVAIGRLGAQAYSVTRFDPGYYQDGRFIQGPKTTLTIQALIQPAGSHDVMRLPEGVRDRKTIAIFTATPLQHARANDATSDRIAFNGETFEVSSIDEWDDIGGYNKVLASKVQDLSDGSPSLE
jgi:hypothetical protein